MDPLSLPKLKDSALLEHGVAGPNSTFWASSSRLRSTLPRFSRNRGRSSFGFPVTASTASFSFKPVTAPSTGPAHAYHSSPLHPFDAVFGNSRAANAIEAVHQLARSSSEAQREMSSDPAADPFGGFRHFGLACPLSVRIEDVDEEEAEMSTTNIRKDRKSVV